ncbi:MAG: ABC transporter ATP-binding protein [Planctomycetaceae bacterium]|nr:ABC transporter ATP-binding protein [Planctomycetaceae bacterium]
MTTPIIQIAGLSKSFNEKRVLNGVDLDIPQGSVVGLLGTNGSGKSTLIKCVLGLLSPTDGTISILGEDPWTLSAEAKERLGYVPQEVKLYPWMRVKHVVGYTAAFYPKWDYAWGEELLDRWQLPREDRVGPLSAGQLQKLALVLALGHHPELLILDEPVASLDPIARREFLRTLLDLAQDERHTVLFSTHITSDLDRVASHVALLQDGKITCFEELDALKDRVKRLRITAAGVLPRDFSIPGTLRADVEGNLALVTATHVTEEMLEQLKREHHAEVAVESLNLEEIFLELHAETAVSH